MNPRDEKIFKIGGMIIICLIVCIIFTFFIRWSVEHDAKNLKVRIERQHIEKMYQQKVDLYNKKIEAYSLVPPECVDIKDLTEKLEQALNDYNKNMNNLNRRTQ